MAACAPTRKTAKTMAAQNERSAQCKVRGVSAGAGRHLLLSLLTACSASTAAHLRGSWLLGLNPSSAVPHASHVGRRGVHPWLAAQWRALVRSSPLPPCGPSRLYRRETGHAHSSNNPSVCTYLCTGKQDDKGEGRRGSPPPCFRRSVASLVRLYARQWQLPRRRYSRDIGQRPMWSCGVRRPRAPARCQRPTAWALHSQVLPLVVHLKRSFPAGPVHGRRPCSAGPAALSAGGPCAWTGLHATGPR